MAAPAPADPNLNREMDELAAQMNNLNIGRNPQNPAVPPVAAPNVVPNTAPIAAMPAAMPEAVPFQNFEEPQVVPNAPPSVQYDLDHDVVMRTPYHYNLTQIPEPGFFSGNPNETDLFCELCEATFTTYLSRYVISIYFEITLNHLPINRSISIKTILTKFRRHATHDK